MKIYIAYTGGTIGMIDSPQGYIPDAKFADTVLGHLQAYNDQHEYRVHCYPELIDSSNASPMDWYKIATDIHEHWHTFDGFLVLHGTDTMAYTSSALAFMFQNSSKPIVVTGSQIPMCQPRNDALTNVYGAVEALIAAKEPQRSGVFLYFGGTLFAGARAKKTNTEALTAFSSPQVPALGQLGIEWRWQDETNNSASKVSQASTNPLLTEVITIPKMEEGAVTLLPIFPGIQASQLSSLLSEGVKGAVLLSYGAGNGPDKNSELLSLLKAATDSGCVIVNISQCGAGAVAADTYATGVALQDAGVISGRDMTYEAAFAKLHFLIGLGLSSRDIRQHFSIKLADEVNC